jgi:hypothetical protein
MTDFVGNVKQLNALPSGSVILAQFPAGAGEKHPDGRSWWFAGSHVAYPATSVPLPARLLWNPEAVDTGCAVCGNSGCPDCRVDA